MYRITNTANGKVYIGKTKKTAAIRWSMHLTQALCPSQRRSAIHRAIRKYGVAAFVIDVIGAATSIDELNALEIHKIAEYDSTNSSKGYNLSHGGEGGNLSAEGRRRLSESMKGRVFSPETREKMSIAKRGKPSASKGTKRGPSPKRGRKVSEETVVRIKAARARQTAKQLKKRTQYENLSASMMGHKHSEETLKKLSQRAKEGFANGRVNPMTGIPSPMKGVRHTGEALAKIRKAKREYWARIRAQKEMEKKQNGC